MNAMNLQEFCERFPTIQEQEPQPPISLDAGKQLMQELLADPGWFAEFLQKYVAGPAFQTDQPGSVFDNEIRLYRSPDKSFTLLAYLWARRTLCVVHDHGAWGLIGSFLYPLREVKYRRLDDGQVEGYANLEQGSDSLLKPGEVGVVLPLDKGIHQTGSAGDRLTISLGVYGRSLRPGYIHFFDPRGKKVRRATTRLVFKKVLALRALASLEEALGRRLLTSSLLESLPEGLVRQFRQGSSSSNPI
jgi:predicted metal-dependent enzyme (double-stranded beta helix superfamily)